MYHNLLDGLMLSLSPIVVPFSRWICWGWMIARSAGATTLIARGAGATASVSSSLLSSLHQIPAIVSDTGHSVQRRMILIQRSLWTHFNSFICIRWLERMLALLMIPWAHPLTRSHHSQFNVSSQGCQTVKLICFLTWVVISLFLERVVWLLRTWTTSFIASYVPFLALGCSDDVAWMSSIQCHFHFWVPWDIH
jgi:hypothetical protein